MEMATRLDLKVVNRGSTPTNRIPGFSESKPDITLESYYLIPLLLDWGVMDVNTMSDLEFTPSDCIKMG